VRVLIVSDLHANIEAVESLPGGYDQLWVLGDLVTYGPDPAKVIDFVRRNASLVVRGNHDHSIGFGKDPRCSARFVSMAKATGRYTLSILSGEDRDYLRNLPLKATAQVDNTKFLLCHATPSDPLYEYRNEDSRLWITDETGSEADVVLVGHTHLPFRRPVDHRLIVNPGSVGQPKHGRPEACYAIWEEGRLTLSFASYPFEETIRKIRELPLSREVQEDLASVLRNGGMEASRQPVEK
jgi:putative phosphoesterase